MPPVVFVRRLRVALFLSVPRAPVPVAPALGRLRVAAFGPSSASVRAPGRPRRLSVPAWAFRLPPARLSGRAKARADWAKARADWAKARADWAKARADWAKARADWAKARADWAKARAETDKMAEAWRTAGAWLPFGTVVAAYRAWSAGSVEVQLR